MNGFARKAWLILRREILVLIRDRRLVVGVAITSLVVFPALMGLLGNIGSMTEDGGSNVGVVVSELPPALEEALRQVEGIEYYRDPFLAARDGHTAIQILVTGARFEVRASRTDGAAWSAAERIEGALAEVRQREIARELARRNVPASVLNPFEVAVRDTSSERSRGDFLLAALLPYLIIVLLVANANRATYIAVGEKEKRTLASVLVCNVPRPAIVVGKSVAIMMFALFASALLVVGMLLFARLGFTVGGDTLGDLSFRLSAGQAAALMVNIGGLALFVSGLIMVLGTFARSQREAGIYTSPLLFVAIFLAIFSYSTVEFGMWIYTVPFLGNALGIRDTILGAANWNGLAISLVVNLGLFGLLTWISTTMYRRDTVLFRQ